ncbi:hypothetical protein KUH03_27410 [Sphingobacterium sp. E70]|nr:DUF6688 family protein [Sphingobacterium sp. E70]ULT22969.1 hypothetical protein KUH03_27410 [Sphingobacterium sp. E70]
MYIIFFLVVALFAGLIYLLRSAIKRQNKKISFVEYAVIIGYILSLAISGVGLLTHSSQYHEAVDPVDGACYLPFGGKHALSLFIYFVAFNVAVMAIWIKGRKIPPIPLVLALIILMIGSIISIFVLTQVSYHDTSTLSIYVGNEGTFYFIFTPLFCFCFGIGFIWKIIRQERDILAQNLSQSHTEQDQYIALIQIRLSAMGAYPARSCLSPGDRNSYSIWSR